MTAEQKTETVHTCSYECDRPECIRAQRDELAARLTTETSNARGEWVLVPRVPTEEMEHEGIGVAEWTGDVKVIWSAMLAAAPPSAPVGVGEAAREVIESINRFRDAGTRPGEGTLVHWEATLHRALAQQPAAVDGAMVERAWVAFCESAGSARQGIRAALTAALATQHQENGNG